MQEFKAQTSLILSRMEECFTSRVYHNRLL